MESVKYIKFFDTNALLTLGGKVLEEPKFYVALETLRELENIKTNPRKDELTRHQARKAIRILRDNPDKYEVCHWPFDEKDAESWSVARTPDAEIVYNAYKANAALEDYGAAFNEEYEHVLFVTDDVACGVIARDVFELPVAYTTEGQGIYTGYIEITGDEDSINQQLEALLAPDSETKLYPNEYIIINNTASEETTEMRYDGEKLVALKLPSSKFIKGKNALQRCALDALMNKDITTVAVMGDYGSGKTFLSTQMAVYAVKEKGMQSKILGVREPKGEGAAIGYLKGTFEDKTAQFFKPLEQQLEGGQYELQSMQDKGMLETNIPYYMKGTTYNSTFIVVDEAEDLTEAQIRLVGTRVGDNSRIIFSGDYGQSLLDKTATNPLARMCTELRGDPKFACIYLGEDVRSTTSKMFANLFKHTN